MNQTVKRLSKRLLPATIEKYVRKQCYHLQNGPPLYYQLFRSSQLPALIPFDEAFPQAKKRHRRAAYRVPTPEASTALGQNDVVHLDRSQYTVPEDYVSVVSDVLVCSTNEVVLTDDREIVRESSTAKRLKYFNTRPFYTSPEQSIEGYVFLLRSRFHNYYHLLLDALPRLLALTRPPFNQIEQIKLLCPGGLTHTEQFFLSKLDIDHVRPLIVPESNVLYRVEHLIFTPLKTEIGAGYLPPFYRNQLQERLHPNRLSRSSQRIFISREKAQCRRLSNRNELINALTRLGFETYMLEDLTHQEQIELFYHAEVVVGAHGAGLTNVLFSDKMSVVELFPYSWIPYPHYFYLCKSLGHPYRWVWGETEEDRYPHPKYFKVDVDEVLHALDELGIR